MVRLPARVFERLEEESDKIKRPTWAVPPPMLSVGALGPALKLGRGLEPESWGFMIMPGDSMPPIGMPTAPLWGEMLLRPPCMDDSWASDGPLNSGFSR